MAAKKRRKSKKGTTRRRKSSARASTAKRSSGRVAVSMKELNKLLGGGRKKKRKSGSRRSTSHADFFDAAMDYRGGRMPTFASGHGMSAFERSLIADVARSTRKLEELKEKLDNTKLKLEQKRIENFKRYSDEALDGVRTERSKKVAETEAKYRVAVAKHKALVANAIDELKDAGATPEVKRAAKEAGKYERVYVTG